MFASKRPEIFGVRRRIVLYAIAGDAGCLSFSLASNQGGDAHVMVKSCYDA